MRCCDLQRQLLGCSRYLGVLLLMGSGLVGVRSLFGWGCGWECGRWMKAWSWYGAVRVERA